MRCRNGPGGAHERPAHDGSCIIHDDPAPRRRALRAEPRDKGRRLGQGPGAGAGARVLHAVPADAARRGVRRGLSQGLVGLHRRPCRSGRPVGDRPHLADGGDCRAAQPAVRRGCRMGDHQVRVSRQAVPDHADRSAVLGVAGDRRSDLRAGVRRAGLVWTMACRARPEGRSSPCRASSSPPCS